MNRPISEAWKIWSQALRIGGGISCVVVCLWSFGLIGYYAAVRPHQPDPQHGWTVPLRWTHTTYGSPEENEQLLRLHFWFFPLFAVMAAGELIRKFPEKSEPGRNK